MHLYMGDKPFHQKNISKRNILNGEPFLKSIWLMRYMKTDIEKEFWKYTDLKCLCPQIKPHNPNKGIFNNFRNINRYWTVHYFIIIFFLDGGLWVLIFGIDDWHLWKLYTFKNPFLYPCPYISATYWLQKWFTIQNVHLGYVIYLKYIYVLKAPNYENIVCCVCVYNE